MLSFTTRPNEDVEKDFNCTLFFCEDMSNCRIVPETDEVVLIRMFKPFSASSIVLSSQEHSSSENDKLTLQFNLRLTDVMNNSEQPITTEYIIDKNYTVNMSFSSTYLLGNNSKEIDMARIISTTPYTTPPARYHSHPSLQRYFTKTASLPTVHNQTFINYFNITTRPPTDTADAINKASYISNTTSPDIANTEYKYSFDVKTTSNSTPHKINYTTMKTLFRTFTHNSELLSVTIKPPKTASMSLINVTQSLHDFYTRQAMNRTSRKEDLDDTLMASNDSVIASTPNNVSGTQYVADSDTILSLNNTVSTLAEKESAMTVYLTDKFTMPTINNTVTTLGMNDNEVTQIVFDTLSNKSSNTPFLTEDRMISLKNHKTETTVTNPTEYFEMNSSLQTVMTTMNNFTTQLSEGYSALSEGNTEITNGKTFRSTFISNMSSNTTIVIPTNRTVLPLPFDINTTVSSSTNRSDNAALISTRRLPILEKPVSPSNRDIYENKIMTINYAGNSSSSIVSYFNYTGGKYLQFYTFLITRLFYFLSTVFSRV